MKRKSKEGGWKCIYCNEVLRTRKELFRHQRENHYDLKYDEFGKWKSRKKGRTKENDESIRRQVETFQKRYAAGEIKSRKGHKHTEEWKRKMSEMKKQYYRDHPELVPFKLYSRNKGESYPEKYFREWLDSESITYKQEYRFDTYYLDFLIGNIDLEIDGEQHFRTEARIKRDEKRNNFLESNGFQIIRIRWSHFMSLTKEERSEYLAKLKNMLLSSKVLPKDLVIEDNKIKRITGYCEVCKKPLYCKARRFCSVECYQSVYVIKNKPSKKQLLEDYQALTTCQIAKKYNTSHTNVGRWRKKYGIATPSRKKKNK